MNPRVYRLVIGPEADEEIRQAALWYESRERGLGREFPRAFRAATGVLRRNPLLYQALLEQVRRVLLRRFPYSIFYEVYGSDVVILACLHEARDPHEWQERLTRP